jgi:quercetin dioxygenase-like cupin family protein
MEIDRTGPPSKRGPADWFTGEVWLDQIASARPPSRQAALSVHFRPGARTAWHHHPFGQVLHVLEGVGRAQTRGGPVQVIRAGDTIRFDPDEEHWHGAAPDRFMTHLALQETADDGQTTYWLTHVTDAEYGADPAAR